MSEENKIPQYSWIDGKFLLIEITSMAEIGYDTCPMEGFDSEQIKQHLALPPEAEISMVIGCGIRAENGIYGPQFRLPLEKIYFEK